MELRDQIVTLALPPGAPINEERLGRELQLGRTPLREAIKRLALENLISVYPRRGTFVTEINITDLAHISDVRVQLEGHAAYRAAQRLTPEQRDELDALLAQVERPAGGGDGLMELDAEVHRFVYRCAGNPYLRDTLERYLNLSLRIWYLVLAPPAAPVRARARAPRPAAGDPRRRRRAGADDRRRARGDVRGGDPERAVAYDYVIVGGGSAGCVLANRLSEDPSTRVLVLEAGRADWLWDVFIHMPAALPFPIGSRFYDWRYESEPEPHMGGRRVYHARGKVLGGSSSINGMIFQRGNPLDFEKWGLAEWDYAHCLPYFKRMETCTAGADEWRGGRRAAVARARPGARPAVRRAVRGRPAGRLLADRRRQRLQAGGLRAVRPQHPPRAALERGARLPAPGAAAVATSRSARGRSSSAWCSRARGRWACRSAGAWSTPAR